MVRFAHLADVHIGAWKDVSLSFLPNIAFDKSVDVCLEENVDFLVISGDLFDTSLPAIDFLKLAVKSLRRLKSNNIPVYCIPGSHDFSPSGKSMLVVLEEAGLLVNVFKGVVDSDGKFCLDVTIDEKTGVILTGILGRKGGLERHDYSDINLVDLNSKVSGNKSIFLFHSSIDELKPVSLKMIDSSPVSLLPKSFSYYAGGHVHVVANKVPENYSHVVYPGPVFPASFSELEKLSCGSMMIVNEVDGVFVPLSVPIVVKEVVSISVDCVDFNADKISSLISDKISNSVLSDKIVLLRVSGFLKGGSTNDINFKKLFSLAYEKGAFVVLRNTSLLSIESLKDSPVIEGSTKDIEDKIILDNVGKISFPCNGLDEFKVTKDLISSLSSEKHEGETKSVYVERILDDAINVLGLNK